MTEKLSRFRLASLAALIALGCGLTVGLAATGFVWTTAQWASRAADVACATEKTTADQEAVRLEQQLAAADGALAHERVRTELFTARLLLGNAATELALSNFGTANDRVAQSATVVDAIDVAAGGLDAAAVARVRGGLGSTRLEVTRDTMVQLKLLEGLSGAIADLTTETD